MRLCTGKSAQQNTGRAPRRFSVTIAAPGCTRAHCVAIARSSAELIAGLIDRLPLGSFVAVRAL